MSYILISYMITISNINPKYKYVLLAAIPIIIDLLPIFMCFKKY